MLSYKVDIIIIRRDGTTPTVYWIHICSQIHMQPVGVSFSLFHLSMIIVSLHMSVCLSIQRSPTTCVRRRYYRCRTHLTPLLNDSIWFYPLTTHCRRRTRQIVISSTEAAHALEETSGWRRNARRARHASSRVQSCEQERFEAQRYMHAGLACCPSLGCHSNKAITFKRTNRGCTMKTDNISSVPICLSAYLSST